MRLTSSYRISAIGIIKLFLLILFLKKIYMPILLAILIGPLVYFVLGYLSSSIYYSFYPVAGNDALTEIISKSAFIYAIVGAIYNFIMECIGSDSELTETFSMWVSIGMPIGSWFLCYDIFPLSEGAALLNYILCLGSMIYFGFRGWKKIIL